MAVENMSVGFWVIVGLMILAVALLGSFLASLYRKAGPHEALIVYGFRGTRIVKATGR
jgi:flotillin